MKGKQFVVLFFAVIFAIFLTGCISLGGDDTYTEKLTLKTSTGDHTFKIEVADDSAERSKGLMHRESMGDDKGMFFIYHEEFRPKVWMPNMNFSLDIVFMDKDYNVVDYIENIPPCELDELDDCPRYLPSHLAQYFLELNAGTADKIMLARGDKAELI